jgi:hypothetical protein
MLKLTWDKLWAQKLPLFLIIFFFSFTPLLIYLLSVRFQAQDLLNLNKLLEQNKKTTDSGPNLNSLENLKKNLEQKFANTNKTQNTSSNYSGPTLHFSLNIEGRTTDQSTKLFVGIAQGSITNNPTYLLSFLVDIPPSGEYSGLSVTGIDIGQTYTAYFKGASQIAKAVTFTSQSQINEIGLIGLPSGDLNDDNQINNSDLEIERKLIGQTPNLSDWNKYADFNQDFVINNIDLTYVSKNQGKVGDGGPWVSSPLKQATILGIATQSGQPRIISPQEASPGGYWLWIPKF